MKAYSEGAFVTECLIDVAQEICPKMLLEIQKSLDGRDRRKSGRRKSVAIDSGKAY